MGVDRYYHAGVWRNGSASDSRSEGWEFESLCPHDKTCEVVSHLICRTEKIAFSSVNSGAQQAGATAECGSGSARFGDRARVLAEVVGRRRCPMAPVCVSGIAENEFVDLSRNRWAAMKWPSD